MRVRELAERLNVSEVTVRKDLGMLEEMGYLRRSHGGAVLAEASENRELLTERMVARIREKELIARRAAKLIVPGETVFIDSGTTCGALAREVQKMALRVVTNSLTVMNLLANAEGIALHTLGGAYRHEADSFIGPIAEAALERLNIDTAFMGTSGVGVDGTLASQNTIEAQLKGRIIARASRSVVLFDRSKLGKTPFAVFAGPSDLGALVTDAPAESLEPFAAAGVEILSVYKGV